MTSEPGPARRCPSCNQFMVYTPADGWWCDFCVAPPGPPDDPDDMPVMEVSGAYLDCLAKTHEMTSETELAVTYRQRRTDRPRLA